MATDGFVQTVANNTGKSVDSNEKINFEGQTVEQLRMAVPDATVVSGDALNLILNEIQITNLLIAQAFGISDKDIEQMRADTSGAL